MMEDLKKNIIQVLKTILDPEIPVNIYELGLIYDIDISDTGFVRIKMTLTSPGCPVAGSIATEVETKVRTIAGVSFAKVELVWDPPWSKDRMSDAAKLQLNLF